jgi:hypothetical protein
MIIPTAADMLKTVERTFESVIKPDLSSTAIRSAAATVSHMLRIATLRVETEGQILHDEALRLRELLTRVEGWLGGSSNFDEKRDPSVYPSLAIMAEAIGTLRQAVCDALEALQGRALDAEGAQLVAELHSYIAWQLEQESKMIDPATIGHGPRR